MDEDASRQTQDPMAMCGEMVEGAQEGGFTCPMAAIFQKAVKKARWLALPGVILIAVGVAILFEPTILVWLMAGTSILVGAAIVFLATFVARLGAQVGGA